jgi:hypothetical protein
MREENKRSARSGISKAAVSKERGAAKENGAYIGKDISRGIDRWPLTLVGLRVPNTATTASSGFRRSKKDGIIGVRLHVLLQILWSLECFTAEIALVRLERDVHSNMRSDVITLDSSSPAVAPLACEIQIIGAFAADMALANMVLHGRD